MKLDPIYVITMIKSKDYFEKFRKRVVGFYHEFENAEETVLKNSLDIYENEYDLAIIEKQTPGEYSCCFDRWFYKYVEETETYITCEEPEDFKSTINFGIG